MPEPLRFPDIPAYEGWGAPHRLEAELRDLEVIEGAVPESLQGSLYRCGPDRQYPPMHGDDIFIDGEGMVHQFRFDKGHVDYRSRWVRTERFLLQEAARRSLFGRYRNRYTNDPSVAGKDQSTANTSVVWHGGRLLVLKEDALPMEIDPDTLATRGRFDYGGAVKAVSLTAHPKLDQHRNELLSFSYQARGDASTDFIFYTMDARGEVVHEIPFHMPYPAMVHDFAVTEGHLIVPFFPLITDLEVVKAGGPYYQWHPDKDCFVAIVPRRGEPRDIRWFRGEACSAGHMVNAFEEEGGRLHLDLCLYAGNCFPFFPSVDGSDCPPCPPRLTRLSFDLTGGGDGFARRQLGEMACELPQIDERYTGRPYRHAYTVCYQPPRRTSKLGHWDVATGSLKLWDPGADSAVQEAKFVPRERGSAEGDGYLLVPVNRVTEMRSDLAILDARDIEAGPVALVRLPTRIRSSFHGCYVPDSVRETGVYSV